MIGRRVNVGAATARGERGCGERGGAVVTGEATVMEMLAPLFANGSSTSRSEPTSAVNMPEAFTRTLNHTLVRPPFGT